MSKIIAAAGTRGAHTFVAQAKFRLAGALAKYGPQRPVNFPNTGYYLPVIYGLLGLPIKTLGDMGQVLDKCEALLPPLENDDLGLALEGGRAALFAQEIIEALRYVEQPDFYLTGEEVTPEKIWLGAADDIILRKRGVEFVDGSAPGFAVILGAAPDRQIAADIARELQRKNLYVFMAGQTNGQTFTEQLLEAGVQIGWGTRLVSFGPDTSAAIFAVGFATRAAMSFGGLEPGDSAKILLYNKERVFAFALTFGEVTAEWCATGLGAVNYGFPIIADTAIPEIGQLVTHTTHDRIVQHALDVRGLKVRIHEVPVPVAYGPAFEGERVRGEDIYVEMGGGRSQAVEWTTSTAMNQVEDGKVEVFGPDLTDLQPGSHPPLAILVEVAGRQMQSDFEPILERQIHHLLNYAQGVMHIGQRDIAWIRISKAAVEKGFRLADLGRIIHAKYHADFGNILDKVQVKIYSTADKVQEILARARQAYRMRDDRIEGMTDESTDTFYSCTLCQSFAPNHVCVITPERTGLCGAYSWLDCKASFEINPTGPNQAIPKGATLDPVFGQWSGVNEFIRKASHGNVERYDTYSIMREPMTSCGCFECLSAVAPLCNGIMIVDRDFTGMTPSGMKFTTLAGMVGGGNVTPGFLGHSKYYITSRKFIAAEGGIKRIVWMPKRLKEEIRARFDKRAGELGLPDLWERIADETVGLTEEEILPFLEEKQHPAISMDPIL